MREAQRRVEDLIDDAETRGNGDPWRRTHELVKSVARFFAHELAATQEMVLKNREWIEADREKAIRADERRALFATALKVLGVLGGGGGLLAIVREYIL